MEKTWKLSVENLPRRGRPNKITPRAQRRLIQEVIKEPKTASKELQATLASIKASFHDSTIRKRLGKNGIHERVPRQDRHCWAKRTQRHISHLPKIYWLYIRIIYIYKIILNKYFVEWWDKSLTFWKLCVQHKTRIIWHKSGSVVVWWSGAALQLQDLENLP